MSQGVVSNIEVFRNGSKIGEDIDSALAISLTIVETAKINGPKLMATLDDTDNYFSEYFGIVEGDEIKVTVEDENEDTPIDYSFRAAAVTGGQKNTMTVEALESNTDKLREMSKSFISTFGASVEDALRQLCADTKIETFNIGDFASVDMTCATTQSRATAIERMAWELGAIAFICRKSGINFYSREELFSDPIELSGVIVNGLTRCGIGHNHFTELSQKTWVGWSMLSGPLEQGSGPVQYSSLDSQYLLSNLSLVPLMPYVNLPRMDGDLTIEAGDGVVLIAPGGNEEVLYSEILSGDYLVETVAHNWMGGGAHSMRILLAKY